MPAPDLTSEPEPDITPEKVVEAPLPPTVRASGAEEAFCRTSPVEPERLPSDAAERLPKLSVPALSVE